MFKFMEKISKNQKFKIVTNVLEGSWNASLAVTMIIHLIEIIRLNAFYTSLVVANSFGAVLMMLILKFLVMALIGQIALTALVFIVFGLIKLIGAIKNDKKEKQA